MKTGIGLPDDHRESVVRDTVAVEALKVQFETATFGTFQTPFWLHELPDCISPITTTQDFPTLDIGGVAVVPSNKLSGVSSVLKQQLYLRVRDWNNDGRIHNCQLIAPSAGPAILHTLPESFPGFGCYITSG